MKALGVLAILLAVGAYFTGALSPSFSRVVSRPQSEVMAALEDLDITAQPGSPGTDPARSGGVRPVFRLEKTDRSMTWYVMSGEKVATAMTATFEPVTDGRETRVRASVERGDAPDDFVSPAFRSTGITMGLFGMALEGELNKLVAPPPADPATCQQMMEEFEQGNRENGSMDRPQNLTQAVGGTARTIMRLNAMEAELRRRGCLRGGEPGQFRPVSNKMGMPAVR